MKIGDFGESIFLIKEYVTTQMFVQDNSRNMGGIIPFVAPEVLKGSKPNKVSDIYSFEMFLTEMLCPARSKSWADDCIPMLVHTKIIADERPTLPSQCTGLPSGPLGKFTGLIKKCWLTDITDRPDAKQILEELESTRRLVSPLEPENKNLTAMPKTLGFTASCTKPVHSSGLCLGNLWGYQGQLPSRGERNWQEIFQPNYCGLMTQMLAYSSQLQLQIGLGKTDQS